MEIIVRNHCRVGISYCMTDSDGTLIDEYNPESPLIVTLGCGEVFDKLERYLLGKTIGQSFQVTLSSTEAFGDYQDGLTLEISRDKVQIDQDLCEGMPLQTSIEGEVETVWITSLTEDSITVDLNHPWAGIDLSFEGVIESIEPEGSSE